MNLHYRKIVFLLVVSSIVSSCGLGKRMQRDQEKIEFVVEEQKEEKKERKKDPPPNDAKTEKKSGKYIEKYAVELGVKSTELGNEKLYEYIDGWIGVPYKYAGNTKEGVDCSGFINAIYKDVYNVLLKRSATDIVLQCDIIEKDKLKEGDLVFFDISSKNSHIGLYLVNNKFIHASSSKGVMISDLTQAYFTKYWGRAGTIKK